MAVVGLGGLGSSVCQALARAGVGRLILVDHDTVSLSDLNRQILYGMDDVGRLKVEAASERIRSIRDDVDLTVVAERVEECAAVLSEAHVVADCLDNMPSRFFLDEVCRRRASVLVHGGVDGLFGQVTTVLPDAPVRLKNLFKGAGSAEAGTSALCSSCMTVGAIQALEIINFIVRGRQGLSFAGRLLSIDLCHFSLESIGLG